MWIDLRLTPVAAGVWTATLVAPLLSPGRVLAAGLGFAGLALLVRRRRGRAVAALLGVLAGLAVAGVTAAIRAEARAASPLRAIAEGNHATVVVLVLGSDPHLLAEGPNRRVVADATVTALGGEGAGQRLSAPVLLFAPAQTWRGLLPGQSVRARVGVSAPRAGDDVVAVLSARGPPTLLGRPDVLQRTADTVRNALAGTAGRVLDPKPAGLLPGLVVGDTRAMDPVLIAVSGAPVCRT